MVLSMGKPLWGYRGLMMVLSMNGPLMWSSRCGKVVFIGLVSAPFSIPGHSGACLL